jgi:hypothetical protein
MNDHLRRDRNMNRSWRPEVLTITELPDPVPAAGES